MNTCPVCEAKVTIFKTNSHVIPRWMMVKIKDTGRYIQISDKTIEKKQRDYIADIVCKDCEDLFTECDTFAKKFFDEKKYLIGIETVGDAKIEKHKEICKDGLARFVISLAIRAKLYEMANDKSITLGKFVKYLIRKFVKKDHEIQMVQFFFEEYKYFHTFPQKTRFDNMKTIEVLIFGYQFYIFNNEKLKSGLKEIAQSKLVIFPIIQGTANQLSKDMFERIKNNKNLIRKKKF